MNAFRFLSMKQFIQLLNIEITTIIQGDSRDRHINDKMYIVDVSFGCTVNTELRQAVN